MLKACIKLLSHTPLQLLYCVADFCLYPLIYYVARYRRTIVRKNLKASFPDYTGGQIRQIERRFYHHFADVIVEIIKGYTISDNEMQQRVTFHNVNLVEELAAQYGGVFIMLGHYGNWEWMADIAKRYTLHDITLDSVYRRLKNKTMDQLMYDIRLQRGTTLSEKRQILRTVIARRAAGIPTSYGMISDQKPSAKSTWCLIPFLHQQTPFLDGTETLARKFGYPIVYFHIEQPKRGYYDVTIRCISTEPKNEPLYEPTKRYAQWLEQDIIAAPHLWLWTHNRWKTPLMTNNN